MGFTTASLLSLALLPTLSLAASASDWATRSIYQVLTDRFALTNGSTDQPCDLNLYCGGSWQGLINKLDYIQGMGFTAVQISPVDTNIPNNTIYGEAYHGYWPMDKYGVNANFGSADDLNSLATALHNRGMYLLGDIVINDVAIAFKGQATAQTPIDYSTFDPYNKPEYFHPFCNITDYGNATNYQDCWFGTSQILLPDLDTSNQDVVKLSQAWISGLVSNYTFDGMRIDAAKHVDTSFLPPIIKAAGVFTFGEVDSAPVNEVCVYDNVTGLENYPIYYSLIPAFTAGDMIGLSQTIKDVQDGCKDTSQLSTFSENQDQPRIATRTPDMALAANTLAFTILADGIPKVYQGQEQHSVGNYSPFNRNALWKDGASAYDTNADLYKLTATLNNIRNHAINIDSRYVSNHSVELFVDNGTMATSKGPNGVNIVAIFSNQGSKGGSYQLQLGNAFQPGTNVTEVLSCNTTVANEAGNITALMGAGAPHAYFPTFQLNGSGLCGSNKATNGSSGSGGNASVSGSDNKTSGAWSSRQVDGRSGMWLSALGTALFVGMGMSLF